MLRLLSFRADMHARCAALETVGITAKARIVRRQRADEATEHADFDLPASKQASSRRKLKFAGSSVLQEPQNAPAFCRADASGYGSNP